MKIQLRKIVVGCFYLYITLLYANASNGNRHIQAQPKHNTQTSTQQTNVYIIDTIESSNIPESSLSSNSLSVKSNTINKKLDKHLFTPKGAQWLAENFANGDAVGFRKKFPNHSKNYTAIVYGEVLNIKNKQYILIANQYDFSTKNGKKYFLQRFQLIGKKSSADPKNYRVSCISTEPYNPFDGSCAKKVRETFNIHLRTRNSQ